MIKRVCVLAFVGALVSVSSLKADFSTFNGKIRHFHYDYATHNVTETSNATAFGPDTVWDASTTVGSFWNGAVNTGLTGETVDWGQVATGTRLINGFTIGYATDSTTDVGMNINFYNPHTTGVVDPQIASFALTLPGLSDGTGIFGGSVTIDLEGIAEFFLNPDFEYGYQYTSMGDGTALGPLLVAEDLVNAPGTADTFTTVNASFWDEYDTTGSGGQAGGGVGTTFWFGDPATGAPYAQFYMTLHAVPEPGSASVLILAGIAGIGFCRRRRK